MDKKHFLGVEFGSTRIKATIIDENYCPIANGAHMWESTIKDGVWTYDLPSVWDGLRDVLSQLGNCGHITAVGISGMMHGYLAFDKDWNLLVPFRTWQNTITSEAAQRLTEEFNFNIPQRWSIAHLYQAILNKEEHVCEIAHLTTLSGYVHYMLTGENVVGIGEASGIFPIDSLSKDYDAVMLEKMDNLFRKSGSSLRMRELLPKVLMAGESAGTLTASGAALIDGQLPIGVPFAPPEGDAGTGMVATNAVAPRTGNVSAGTSIFTMIVLEHPLCRVYSEIDMVTTPSGNPVAMIHCNNCTGEINAWARLFSETFALLGLSPDMGDIFQKLFEKSLQGDADCGGVLVCNYLAGEGVTHLDEGRPMVIRKPESHFTLANFLRAQLYSALATLKIGMDLLASENVPIDSLTGHGGLFKTPNVGQQYLAAACNTAVTCMTTAGEGGPFGMAVLSSYMMYRQEYTSLEEYLDKRVFIHTDMVTVQPDPMIVQGFCTYTSRFKESLSVEERAIQVIR